MAGLHPHRAHRAPRQIYAGLRRSTLRQRGLLAALMIAGALSLQPDASAATDPRIIARYFQMLEANPVEGNTLERLWAVAEKEGLKEKFLEEAKAKAASGDFRSQLIYGLFLSRNGEGEAAQAAFERAAELAPESPLPHRALANLASTPAEKAAALEKAVSLMEGAKEGEKIELLTELGSQWLAAGDFEKASAAWEQIAMLAPASLELRSRLASLYREHGFPQQAIPHFQVIAEKGTPQARVEALRALSALAAQSGEVDAALGYLERALSSVAGGHWLRRELLASVIQISQEHGQVEALEKRWKAAAEASPRAPELWLQLADLYHAEGDNAAESAALERAALLLPGDVALQRRWARSLSQGKAWEAAASVYDTLLSAKKSSDLIFERAELDIRLGQIVEAQRRVSEWEVAQKDPAVTTQALDFFARHRMEHAQESLLRRAGGDPLALAEFLFAQRRPGEAVDWLRGLAALIPDKVRLAEGHQRAAEILKRHGEVAAADEAMQAAVIVQPESRALHLALGDFVAERNLPLARKAYAEAYRLSQSEAEKVEADQRLFNAAARRERQTVRDGSTVGRIFAASEGGGMGRGPAHHGGPSKALQEQIALLKKEAEADKSPAAPLRLARWLFWSQDYPAALGAAAEAQARDAGARGPVELRIAIFNAEGRRYEAIEEYRRLIEIAPKEKARWQKEIALLHFGLGQPGEALALLEELAAGGEAAALVDLATGQQRAERWMDALKTWETLYREAKGARRAEYLQPLVQAQLRLGQEARVRETLWEAFLEQEEEGVRQAILKDLIQHCTKREELPWLIAQLRARVAGRTAQVGYERLALGRVLRAAGEEREAVKEMEAASLQARDRAGIEETLVADAEAGEDFALAARHQKRRLGFLAEALAPEWERLAALQEQAGDEAEAAKTRAEIAQRFPRDSEALLLTARAYERWGLRDKATEIYRAIHLFEPSNLEAAAALIPEGEGALTAEGKRAAEALLAQSTADFAGPVILPPVPPALENRLRAHFSSTGRGVMLYIQEDLGNTLAEWRLQAIRALARHAVASGTVASWLEQWEGDEHLPTEKLWAYHFAQGSSFDYLCRLVEGAEPPQRGAVRNAFFWSALYEEEWQKLGAWLWKPERTLEEFESFKGLLGEWARLQRPIDLELLFKEASSSYLWPCAQIFADAHRHQEAVELGWKVLGEEPGALRYRGGDGLQLVDWLLTEYVGRGEPMMSRAVQLLREIAQEPADSFDAAAFEAQRLLYHLLPPAERQVWMREMLAKGAVARAPGAPSTGASAQSPVYKALTESLLTALDAVPGDAASQRALREAQQRLVALRATGFDEMPVTERVWKFLLDTGMHLVRWKQPEAAAILWETALADKVDIALQGHQASSIAGELRVRLHALRLAPLAGARFRVELEAVANELSSNQLTLLASHLEASGCLHGVAEIYSRLYATDEHFPLNRVINAGRAAQAPHLVEAALQRWKERGRDRRGLALVVEALGDATEARQLATEAVEAYPDDLALLDQLSSLQIKARDFGGAEITCRRLLALRPNHVQCRLKLAEILAEQGRPDEALKIVRAAPERAPQLEQRALSLCISLGQSIDVHALSSEAVRTGNFGIVAETALLIRDAGQREVALTLLNKAVDIAIAGKKPRAAFSLQLQYLKLLGPRIDADAKARNLKKLRSLAGGRQEFLSAYFELTEEPQWQPRDVRQTELLETWNDGKGSTVGGAWLAASYMDAGEYAATADFLTQFLARPDIEEPLLTWLDDKSRALGRSELSFIVTDALLKRAPNRGSSAFRRIRTLRTMGRLPEARALLQRAEAKSLVQPPYAELLATEAVELDEPILARRLFERVLESLPRGQESEVPARYARFLLSQGDTEACKSLFQHHIRTRALNDMSLAVLAQYLKLSGQTLEEGSEELGLHLDVKSQEAVYLLMSEKSKSEAF